MDAIERMQKHLRLIRKTAGWTAEEFGKKIGVTKQTISNLEKDEPAYKLTKTQYIAMRYVLDHEIENNDDTKMLKSILEIFVDNPDKYTKKQHDELLRRANMIAPSILENNATREETSNYWIEILTGVLAVGAASIIASLATNGKTISNGARWFDELTTSIVKKK